MKLLNFFRNLVQMVVINVIDLDLLYFFQKLLNQQTEFLSSKDKVLVIYQRKSHITCILHVFNYLALKAFRKLLIFTQFFKDIHDLITSIVQYHRSVKRKLCNFVLMNEFRPVDGFT